MASRRTLFVLIGVLMVIPFAVPAQDTSVQIISIDEEKLREKTGVDTPVPVNRVLAVVGEQVITMADYRAEYGDTTLTYGRLNPMIDRLLLLSEARSRELNPDTAQVDQLVDRQLERIKQRTGSLDAILQQRGLTRAQLEDQVRRQAKTRILESRLLARMFPEVRSQDTQPAYVSVRARLFFVEELTRAWRVYGWLQDQPTQQTWNKLFDQYSSKLSLMEEHGNLGWFTWGQFNRQIEYRVFKLPLYAVSEPFPLRDGFALVYPTGYRLEPNVPSPSRTIEVYRRYRRRFLVEKMYDRLRRNNSVIIPRSVEGRLNA